MLSRTSPLINKALRTRALRSTMGRMNQMCKNTLDPATRGYKQAAGKITFPNPRDSLNAQGQPKHIALVKEVCGAKDCEKNLCPATCEAEIQQVQVIGNVTSQVGKAFGSNVIALSTTISQPTAKDNAGQPKQAKILVYRTKEKLLGLVEKYDRNEYLTETVNEEPWKTELLQTLKTLGKNK